MHPRNGRVSLIVLASLLGAGGCAAQEPVARPRDAAAPAGEFATADDLLAALERADQNLTSLTSEIRYDRTFELQGDRQVRLGNLFFIGGDARKFAVSFKTLLVGEVRRDETKIYIFDGQYLIEKYPDEKPKLFIKRQVVPPGEVGKFDPLRVGQGPFPLPIGQKAADIKARFNVELAPLTSAIEVPDDADAADKAAARKLVDFVAGATQIKLVPKPQFAPDEDFVEIRLWYRRDAGGHLLPRMARTRDKGGNISVIQLINVHAQRTGEAVDAAAAVPPDMLDTTEPPDNTGWNKELYPWQKSATEGAAPKREGKDAGDP